MKPDVSIIVPVYNVRPYLARCLSSLTRQSHRNIEILIVDDCSTDTGPSVIKEYARKDSRLTYIKHRSNRGLGATYNTGLNHAVGEFVAFVEPDDWVDSHFVEILFNAARSTNSAVTRCRFKMFHLDGSTSESPHFSHESNKQLLQLPLVEMEHICIGFIGHWAGLYKRDYLQRYGLRFLELPGPGYVDTHFFWMSHALAGNITVLSRIGYNYALNNPTSSVNCKDARWLALVTNYAAIRADLLRFDTLIEHEPCLVRAASNSFASVIGILADPFKEQFCHAVSKVLADIPEHILDGTRASAEERTTYLKLKHNVYLLDAFKKECIHLRKRNRDLSDRVDSLENSRIWRATAPLRFFADKLRASHSRLFRKAIAPLHFEQETVAIDISTIWHHDAGTGIQRVVRKMAIELASATRGGKRIVLVDYSGGVPLDVTEAFFGSSRAKTKFEKVAGMEMLIMLDSSYNLAPSFSRRLREANRDGVFVVSVCHDLLPVTNPEWFLAVNHIPFRRWLNLATDYSSAFLCVSETTATRLRNHLETKRRTSPPTVASWPLGYDLDNLATPIAHSADEAGPFALMVGTVEPRKNHIFVLETLARLRAEGAHVPKLVVVGRYGWKNKRAKRLLRDAVSTGWAEWHDHGIPDEDLSDLYSRAHCVIQASLDEGFGLPVAEAAAMGKPVVLSDIPVFREIVTENGYFFRLGDAKSFGDALISACKPDAKPTTTKAVSWQESADIFWQRCLELREAEIARRTA